MLFLLSYSTYFTHLNLNYLSLHFLQTSPHNKGFSFLQSVYWPFPLPHPELAEETEENQALICPACLINTAGLTIYQEMTLPLVAEGEGGHGVLTRDLGGGECSVLCCQLLASSPHPIWS